MTDVAIIGIGMHPFGRHNLTGLEQGAVAARKAMADAGVEWKDVQYAFGGSQAAGNADCAVPCLKRSESPLYGMAGVSGINSVRLAQRGCAVTVVDENAPRLAAVEFDDDADGVVNDGCPTNPIRFEETGAQCLNAVDDDGDGVVNDGCPMVES